MLAAQTADPLEKFAVNRGAGGVIGKLMMTSRAARSSSRRSSARSAYSVLRYRIFLVAGGLVLLVLAISDLVVGGAHDGRGSSARADFGAVPIGTPILAGPATLATLLVLVDKCSTVPRWTRCHRTPASVMHRSAPLSGECQFDITKARIARLLTSVDACSIDRDFHQNPGWI
jgi:hypothetical protein